VKRESLGFHSSIEQVEWGADYRVEKAESCRTWKGRRKKREKK